jgi:hypothetical protein
LARWPSDNDVYVREAHLAEQGLWVRKIGAYNLCALQEFVFLGRSTDFLILSKRRDTIFLYVDTSDRMKKSRALKSYIEPAGTRKKR